MSIDVNVQNDLVIVTESSEDITVNVSNAQGPAGVGVPTGGSTGQVLKKASATNYDTYWAVEGGGVPYSGATGDVNLGEYELKAGQVEFDQTPTGTAGVGVMRWNDADGTVDLGLKGGNVTLQVGQEQVLRVVNKTGADLLESEYKAVRIRLVSEGGAQGQRLAVVLAQGNNDPDSTTTIGIVTENIANNQEGFITISGEVRGINTTGSLQGETWADGDIIYLSPTTPGGITKVKPIAPNHMVVLGYVVYAHAVNGKIFTKIDNGYELSELHDCYLPTPSNNDGIFWNTANSRYQNNTIAGVLGYTPVTSARTLTINGTAYDLSADRSWTVSGTNIYTADGTLTGNRVVTNNTYTLTIRNTSASAALILQNTQAYGTGGVYTQYAQQWLSSTGTSAGYVLGDIGRLVMTSMVQAPQFFVGSLAGIIDAGVSRGGSIGINGAPIDFGTATNAGGGTNIGRWFSTGNLLIQTGGTFTDAGYKLDVKGTARVSDQITSSKTSGSAFIMNQNAFFQFSANDIISATSANIIGGTTPGLGIRYGTAIVFGTGGIGYHYLTNNYALFTSQSSAIDLSSGIPASAVLEARSTTKGFLPPRMTTTQRDAIATPATGLQIYNTTTNENNTYNGTAWVAAGGGSNIYTADGTLTGDRTVSNSTYLLKFVGGKEILTNEQTALRLETSTTGKELIFSLNNLSGKNWLIRSLQSGNLDFRNITNTRTTLTFDGASSDVIFSGNIKSSLDYFILGAGAFHKALHLGKSSVTNANYSIAENGAETMINADTGGLLRFRIANADKMMLTNAGRLLLGTTTESTYLADIAGNARVGGTFTISASNGIPAATTDVLNIASGFTTPDIGRIYVGDGTGWKLHFSKRIASVTTDLVSITDTGDFSVSGVLRETITTNRQTASYTLALTDRGKLVEMNVAGANNLTVPLNSSIAFPIGSKIDLSQYGAGQTTIVATGGVTIRSAGGALKLAAQYSGASLVKIGTDEWYLFGDITV